MDPLLLSSMAQVSDHELLARVKQLAMREREVTTVLIAHLAELDGRRLYLAEGHSSLIVYCTQVLHLSEHAAYGRIAAARAARKFPVILEMLCEGSANLSTVCLLAPTSSPRITGKCLTLPGTRPSDRSRSLSLSCAPSHRSGPPSVGSPPQGMCPHRLRHHMTPG